MIAYYDVFREVINMNSEEYMKNQTKKDYKKELGAKAAWHSKISAAKAAKNSVVIKVDFLLI